HARGRKPAARQVCGRPGDAVRTAQCPTRIRQIGRSLTVSLSAVRLSNSGSTGRQGDGPLHSGQKSKNPSRNLPTIFKHVLPGVATVGSRARPICARCARPKRRTMMTNLDVTALREPRAAHYRRLARAAARTVALILGPLTEAYQARRDAAHLMSLDD